MKETNVLPASVLAILQRSDNSETNDTDLVPKEDMRFITELETKFKQVYNEHKANIKKFEELATVEKTLMLESLKTFLKTGFGYFSEKYNVDLHVPVDTMTEEDIPKLEASANAADIIEAVRICIS